MADVKTETGLRDEIQVAYDQLMQGGGGVQEMAPRDRWSVRVRILEIAARLTPKDADLDAMENRLSDLEERLPRLAQSEVVGPDRTDQRPDAGP